MKVFFFGSITSFLSISSVDGNWMLHCALSKPGHLYERAVTDELGFFLSHRQLGFCPISWSAKNSKRAAKSAKSPAHGNCSRKGSRLEASPLGTRTLFLSPSMAHHQRGWLCKATFERLCQAARTLRPGIPTSAL